MAKLTPLKVQKAGPGKFGDGNGLILVVSPKRTKKWILRIQVHGTRRDIGLGSARDVSLADAREAAAEMRDTIRRGEDPISTRRKRQHTPTFREAAKMVFEENRPAWKNKKHAQQWRQTLDVHVHPTFGDVSVDQISGPMIRDVLAPIWLTVPTTARRIRQRIGAVLDFAYAKGWRETEAPTRSVVRGLPKQPKRHRHHPALPWNMVPGFIEAMHAEARSSETPRLCMEYLILTAARSDEVRSATWSEINIGRTTWTIPASRMKTDRAHRVPLSARAIEILQIMQHRSNDPNELVFEGRIPGQPLAPFTLGRLASLAEAPATPHGFRSSFRDWCAEATSTPREVAEACLAHVVRNAVEAAYARTDHLERRRAVMDAWASFCTGRDEGANVVSVSGIA